MIIHHYLCPKFFLSPNFVIFCPLSFHSTYSDWLDGIHEHGFMAKRKLLIFKVMVIEHKYNIIRRQNNYFLRSKPSFLAMGNRFV